MGTGCMCLGHALSHRVRWAGRVFLDHVLAAWRKSCHSKLKRESPQVSVIGPLLSRFWFNSRRQGAKPITPEQVQRRPLNIRPHTKDQYKVKFDQIKISTNDLVNCLKYLAQGAWVLVTLCAAMDVCNQLALLRPWGYHNWTTKMQRSSGQAACSLTTS